MSRFGEPASAVVERLSAICKTLPETHEAPAWAGTRWLVRRNSIAHVFTFDTGDEVMTAVMFRSSGPELDSLRAVGRPFFVMPGWRNAAMMALDSNTDWQEVLELITESYCLMAPKKLVALVDRTQPPVDGAHRTSTPNRGTHTPGDRP